MTRISDAELRRWAVEQAVASYGVDGCANGYNLAMRIEELYQYVTSAPQEPTAAIQQKEAAR